jgi:type IV pilus assembly protein PilA
MGDNPLGTAMRPNSGFTLIELMIVVSIIAILTAIALPAYQHYTIRSQVSEGLVLTAGARDAVWDFISTKGKFPPNNTSAGLASANSITGNFVSSVNASGGLITVTYGNGANALIATDKLLLSPFTTAGSITWTCKSATISTKYLPSNCRG